MADLNPCPLCGALPCDWVDDPHKAEVGLCWTLAKIREVLGVGEKPMLGELPDIIAAALTAQAAEIARLKAFVADAGDQFAFYAENHRAKGTGDGLEKAATNQLWADLARNLTGSQSHD